MRRHSKRSAKAMSSSASGRPKRRGAAVATAASTNAARDSLSIGKSPGQNQYLLHKDPDIIRYTILAIITALAYLPTLSNEFVWDDEIFNDALQVQSLDGIRDIWTKPGTIPNELHYWPMVYTSFWLDCRLFGGNNPVASHAVNVAIHIVNSCLVDVTLKRIGLSANVAYLSAIIFALHPVHVESVAWAIERKDTLSALFYFGALLRNPMVSTKAFRPNNCCKSLLGAAPSLILYALAMLTKSSVVSLPAVLLLLVWFMRGKIRRCEFIYSLPFFIAGAAIAIYDIVQMGIAADKMNFGYTFLQRIMIASRAVCFYLWKVVWPTHLSMIYPLWYLSHNKVLWWSSVLVVGSALLLLFLMRHQWGRGPLVGLLFFGMTVGPMLGLIDYSYMLYSFVADRYQYLAMLGPIAVLSSLVVHGCRKTDGSVLPFDATTKEETPDRFLKLLCLLSLALGLSTHRQCYAYRNNETFFGYSIRQNDAQLNAWHHLGVLYSKNGKPEEAVKCNKKALDLLNNRKAEGDVVNTMYQQMAQILYNNAGNTLREELNRSEEAVEIFGEAVKNLPKSSTMWTLLGDSYSQDNGIGNDEEATRHYKIATSLDPSYAIAWGHMGSAYARLGNYEEAVKAFKACLDLNPQNTFSRMNLATVYIVQGFQEKAVNEYRAILAYEPDNVIAKERMQNSLGAIAKKRRRGETIEKK
mmetsp:Transcript_31636/g.69503  ORF Transcript_31636/g.69503 Transcript_31636/m.69503 type:complete len:696 (-) Transcript_31636:111-2198(-)